MAVTATPVFVQTPKITPQNFIQGTDAAGTFKTICTAGTNGTKVVSIMAASTDTALAHLMTLVLTRGGVDYRIGSCSLPANSGTDGIVSNMDLMNTLITGWPTDNDGQKYFYLVSADTLRLTFATALTASTRIDVICVSGDF